MSPATGGIRGARSCRNACETKRCWVTYGTSLRLSSSIECQRGTWCTDARPRNRDLLRRDRRRGLRRHGRSSRACRAHADGHSRGIRGRGAGARLARSRPATGAAGSARPGSVRLPTRRHRRGGLHRRSGARRSVAGRHRVRSESRLGVGSAGARRAPHGRPSARPHAGTGPAGIPVSRAARLGRAHAARRGRGGRRVRRPRRVGRRCGRRGVRQGRDPARAAVPRRPGARGAGPPRRSGPFPVSPPHDGPSRAGLQLQRPEDIRAQHAGGQPPS